MMVKEERRDDKADAANLGIQVLHELIFFCL
jgi:hypothetical protein